MTSRNVHLLSKLLTDGKWYRGLLPKPSETRGVLCPKRILNEKWIVLCDLVTEIEAVCWVEAGMHINQYFEIIA